MPWKSAIPTVPLSSIVIVAKIKACAVKGTPPLSYPAQPAKWWRIIHIRFRKSQRQGRLVPKQRRAVRSKTCVWAKVGSLPPVKARRRQNAIDQPERCKQSGKPIRSAARWQVAAGLCEPEKICPHSEVRNQTSTANRGAGINTAENRGTARYTKRQPASPVRTIQGIKKALRNSYPQRVRSAQHTPTGRERAFLRR